MASIKQVAMLVKMCRERNLDIQPIYNEQNSGKLSNQRVNELMALIKSNAKVNTAVKISPTPVVKSSTKSSVKVTQGFWKLGHDTYRVNYNQAHTHLYASKLVVDSTAKHGYRWVYASGTMDKIAKSGTKLGGEWVKQFGDLYSHCCLCGRELTIPASVQKGIGPVCADKIGL